MELQRYRRNTYSQNGEDGIIEEICRRLGITDGWFCEFGAWDGRYGSNCYKLLREGWRGVMIEGDPARFKRLLDLGRKYPETLTTLEAYVDHHSGKKSLENLLKSTDIPSEFQVLSIDIDSYDYQVWESLECYRPIIIIIEVDSSVLPGVMNVYQGGPNVATSFSAMLELGKAKDYVLVAHTGNMIFVRSDLVSKIELSEREMLDPSSLFCSEWVNPSRISTLARKLRFITLKRLAIKVENALVQRVEGKARRRSAP